MNGFRRPQQSNDDNGASAQDHGTGNTASAAHEYRYAPEFDQDVDRPDTDAHAQAADDAGPAPVESTYSYAGYATAADEDLTAPYGRSYPAGPTWAQAYGESDHPRRQGTQRSLEEALVSWWSEGRLPSPAVTRDGLLMLEAGVDVDASHRSLLLRAALYYRRGMLTALKHQADPERTALVVREALLDPSAPLPLAELSRLVRDDRASAQWLPRLEDELTAQARLHDLMRSQLANAALIHLTAAPDVDGALLPLTGIREPRVPMALRLLGLIALALLVSAIIGGWAWQRSGADFIEIPGGEYTISNDDGTSRTVTLTPFRMGRHEVTNAEYRACVADDDCPPPTSSASATRTRYADDPAFNDYPVVNVDRNAARAYCQWRGGRLPTESEWQVAATFSPVLNRAYLYPWGDMYASGPANDRNSAVGDTLPVGSLMPTGASPWGNADMAGNVAEWTLTDADGMAVVKGGSFADDRDALTGGVRGLEAADVARPWLGFRCVLTPFSFW